MDLGGIADKITQQMVQQAAVGGFGQGAVGGVDGQNCQNGQDAAMSKMCQTVFETMMEQIKNAQ